MVDFGSAAHGDYFSMADSYDPLSNRRAFYDASYVLPPAMLESYVAKFPATHIENFRYALRSGMLGWFSLMLDASHWTAEQRSTARQEFALYKSALRPLIREADLFMSRPGPTGCIGTALNITPANCGAASCTPFAAARIRPRINFACSGSTRGAVTVFASKITLRPGC
jgi:hypothetical protein